MVFMNKRMEDDVCQDKEITLEVVHKLIEKLEEDYLEADNDEERGTLANMKVFVLVFF